MRILSLHQPYASFVVLGIKTWETRKWSPVSRDIFDNPLGIHATAGIPGYCRRDEHLNRLMEKHGLSWSTDLPLGAIVGSVRLVSTITTKQWLKQYGSSDQMPDDFYLGDYRPGRFAWRFERAERFAQPIPAKGYQRFWQYDV